MSSQHQTCPFLYELLNTCNSCPFPCFLTMNLYIHIAWKWNFGLCFYGFYENTCFCTWQRSLRDIAELYGSESTLDRIEEYRRSSGLQSITSMCFKAARISAILIDDGIEFHEKHEIEWHRKFAPVVGRILRIERLAENILDEVRFFFHL